MATALQIQYRGQEQRIEDMPSLNNVGQALDEAAIVAITDRKGKIIHVNDKFCKISKYSKEELLGQDHRIINSGYHPKSFFTEMWQTIKKGISWEGEVCNRAKDGSYYWVNTTIVPFLDDQGEPYQYVSIRYEITQRKLAEEKLKKYAAKLEISNRELQDFASVAAHDLQEPLRKIEVFSERLATRHESSFSEEGRAYLERMKKAASRMRKLIEDLLTYSRVASKAESFKMTDLNRIVKEVVSDLEVTIEQSEAEIKVSLLPIIEADPAQMRQLFQNLISNALKFHKESQPPKIVISAVVENDFCELRVIDNGIGFDEKYLDRIFTIFQRLHGRTEYEGTGVGLAVVRRISDRHGGSVTATSSPGEGACFTVRLPVRQIFEKDKNHYSS